MKILLLLTFLLATLISGAQNFTYIDSLKSPLTKEQYKSLRTLAERNYLYSGNLNFNVSEGDLSLENYMPDSTYFTTEEGIARAYELLKTASTLDSTDYYLKLYQLYQQKADFDKAMEAVKHAYDILIRLLEKEPVSSDVMKQAGFFTMQTNPDQSQAFPYFANSWNINRKDSTSLLMMITIYYNFSLYQQSDSLIREAIVLFPNSFGPYMFSTQIESMNMFMKYNADPQSVTSKCLTEAANLDKIHSLRKSSTSDRNLLLSYLLEELMFIMKYQMNIAADTFTTILPCDLQAINTMRSEYRRIHQNPGNIPLYTTSHALGWSFAIEQKYDSAAYYLQRAISEIRPLGGSFLGTRTTIANSLMAMQYLGKDTLGAIKTVEKTIAGHDSTGIFAGDYLMLSVLCLKAGQYDRSIAACDNALKYRGDKASACRIKALSSFYSNRKTEAWMLMKQAAEAEKSNMNTYMLYGIMYMLNNDPSTAFKYFEAAWYIEKGNPDLMELMETYFVKK